MPLALLLMAAMFLALLSLPRFSWPMTEGQVDADTALGHTIVSVCVCV